MPPVSTDPYLAEGYLISIGGVSLDIFLIFIFAFVASLFLGNFVYLVVRQGLEGRVSRSTAKWVLAILPYGVIFAGIYANARYILAFDLTAFTTSLGILGIVIAFSSSQIIQTVLAGVLITINRPILKSWWSSADCRQPSVPCPGRLLHDDDPAGP
ncbi:hypothetical protein [Methanofollis sp. UBA420]|jgi:small-conductance mechanosensitive channel|uniref:hypothetical protein n=1 Tax=Methanofollis sp. UBA420 TaxID=1915514 RepID=UPI00316ADA6F